ncbi:hypothetical protein Tco_0672947 [Tanacetum coccineum]
MRNIIFMHTVRDDSVLGTLRFISKFDEYQVYGALLPEGMTNQQMRDSPAYMTYLAFATGAATPKKARKFKKPASPSKKKTRVAIEEPAKKPAKKPTTRKQSAGVQIRDTPGVSVSKKKAPAKNERSKGIELLSNAALLEEAQLKRLSREASGRHTFINLKPGVPDVSKVDSSKSEYESWGDSDDDNDDDDQESDDERTKSDDDDKAADINKTDDEEDDEFVHTPEDYVPTDDEDVDEEEFDRINKEMYSDVNVELKDSEHESEGKYDEEMTDAGQLDVEHEEVSQEVAGETEIILMMDVKVKHEDPTPATTITSLLSLLFPNIQQSTPIPTPTTTEATTSTTAVPDSETLSAIHKISF